MADAAERQMTANLAGTSANYLYQLAGGNHRRKCSVVLAQKIEHATRTMHQATDGRLPVITVYDLAGMYQSAGAAA